MASGAKTRQQPVPVPVACRKFGLLDGMILLAGAALALSSGAHLFLFLVEYGARLCRQLVAQGTNLFTVWSGESSAALQSPPL